MASQFTGTAAHAPAVVSSSSDTVASSRAPLLPRGARLSLLQASSLSSKMVRLCGEGRASTQLANVHTVARSPHGRVKPFGSTSCGRPSGYSSSSCSRAPAFRRAAMSAHCTVLSAAVACARFRYGVDPPIQRYVSCISSTWPSLQTRKNRLGDSGTLADEIEDDEDLPGCLRRVCERPSAYCR